MNDSAENTTVQAGLLTPEKRIAKLVTDFGQRKPMDQSATQPERPHYFLLRRFLTDLDLLIILNTKRCRYRCKFCSVSGRFSEIPATADEIVGQFVFVCQKIKHALSVINRITLSNNGSVLDLDTLPFDALETIVRATSYIRSVRQFVLETRLEFVNVDLVNRLKAVAPRLDMDILTGFETLNSSVRNEFLAKTESIRQFESGLDRVADAGVSLTCFVLLKPSPFMNDEEAVGEAEDSIAYLEEQTRIREIQLTIRLNPMFAAAGTPWTAMANQEGGFVPPRLSDALSVAKRARARGIKIYLGLTAEGLAANDGTFMVREDFSRSLLREAKLFNGIHGQTTTAR